ncbi:MAG: glycoside hydrolase family 78 protein [Anaerolineae bacterium]|nr:glycoside hydrolase family 78 protein [Anaerolineae bacterium]
MTPSQIDSQTAHLETTVVRVRFEHLQETLGIGTPQPRLSWLIETSTTGWAQAAYEIEAYTPAGPLYGQTGRVESSDSVLVAWPFTPLSSRQRVTVRVRVWGGDGQVSAWSELAPVEAGLFDPDDWTGRFIRPDWEEDTTLPQPGPLLRRDFTVRKDVRQARLYITALGVYEASLNGSTVGDHVMAPGWTSYHHRLRYQTFDVTDLLQEGPNTIGAMLGDGWFRGRLGFGGGRPSIYGDRIALLAQLEVEYTDGVTERIVTDETWRANRGPILTNDIYDGEEYDARLEEPGWSRPDYDDRGWAGVRAVEWDNATLFAPLGPPVRRTELVAPEAIFLSPSGRTLIDFGQNLVGWLRLTVTGPAGQTITLRHAEVLEDGELGTRPLRHAKATDRYTLRGSKDGDQETWEPRFTFHGFRYAEVEGWPGELKSENIRAVVCHSDMERTGWFDCSDPLINRLHENVVWGMRGNFLDIPTDCPQRDERLGWTGDIQVFTPTASFLFDSAGFLASWLADLAAEQKALGVVPFVVPTVMPRPTPPAAAWGDAAVVVPWVLYQRFGDVKILEDQFESMCGWVDLIDRTAGKGRLWDQGFQFGDWLDPTAPPEKPADAATPGFIVASAYFARSAEILGQAARILGRKEEEEHYLTLASEVREAFGREYVTPSGRMLSDSATGYALGLQFALLPDESQRRHAAARLVALIRARGYRISTGFVGTPLICDALCSQGHHAAAFRLLTQRQCPSWLYPVTMGATTIWERWDSMLPDGSVNPGEMTSFNHYALGAVADWLHRTVAGLAPGEPGYRSLEIQPRPGGGLSHAAAHHSTPYGKAACSWRLTGEDITVEVEVPPNTTARVILPGKDDAPIEIASGKHTWTYAYQVPEGQRKKLSLDSTVGELIDDAEAFPLVMQALAEQGHELRDGVLAQEQSRLRDAVGFMPWGRNLLACIEEVLSGLDR